MLVKRQAADCRRAASLQCSVARRLPFGDFSALLVRPRGFSALLNFPPPRLLCITRSPEVTKRGSSGERIDLCSTSPLASTQTTKRRKQDVADSPSQIPFKIGPTRSYRRSLSSQIIRTTLCFSPLKTFSVAFLTKIPSFCLRQYRTQVSGSPNGTAYLRPNLIRVKTHAKVTGDAMSDETGRSSDVSRSQKIALWKSGIGRPEVPSQQKAGTRKPEHSSTYARKKSYKAIKNILCTFA